jgi:Putative restriction endonuclease
LSARRSRADSQYRDRAGAKSSWLFRPSWGQTHFINSALRKVSDQVVKASIYAAAGIEDYWIVNIHERTVEVRRQPGPSGYRSLQTYTETDTIAPLFNPTASILVADLLP